MLKGDDLTRGGTTAPDAVRALNEQVGGVNLDFGVGQSVSADPVLSRVRGIGVAGHAARARRLCQRRPLQPGVWRHGQFRPAAELAIDQMNLEGSNPVFGLNALGGALNVQLKNGFTYHGGEIDVSGGSFDTFGGNFQYGKQSGNTAVYVAASGLHQDGWRDLQSSDMREFLRRCRLARQQRRTAFQRPAGELGAERARHVAGGTACRRSQRPVHRAQPDQQPLHAGQPVGQPGRSATRFGSGCHLLQQFPAAGDQRQRAERYAMQRRLGPAVHRFRPQHHARRRHDPGLPWREPVRLFGTGQPDHQHQRLRRLGPGDRYADRVRLQQPSGRRLQLRWRADRVHRRFLSSAASRPTPACSSALA